jgi:nucleotide-binding universal stress UspA family protein
MSEILVGFDDTPAADDALAFAAQIARATGASIRLVDAYPYDDRQMRAADEAVRDYLHEDAGAVLAGAADVLPDVDIAIEPVADVSPARALHDAAERCGAALIVVGSTHRGRVGRVLPGSTGERLLHGASCPVAVVPREYAKRFGAIANIGVGYDASDESAAALSGACRLARRLGAGLHVAHVFDASLIGRPALLTGPAWMSLRDDHEAAQRRELADAIAALPAEVDAQARFIIGRPGEELARVSESMDVMVVGSRGYGPLAAVFLGGVSHRLLLRAASPVVVLPRGARDGLDRLLSSTAEATA